MIIAGDIGGTKTNVALFESDGDRPGRTIAQRSFPSGNYGSLESILEEFIATEGAEGIQHACFGVAGPVLGGRVETPNLAWIVGADSLAATLGVERVILINDLEATAFGIEMLDSSQLHTLSEGSGDRRGHRALIAAGTGLGMAAMYYDGTHYQPMASEGGHIDFAPRNQREYDLLVYLSKQLNGRVSYERVLSGPGLFGLYSFLRDTGYCDEPDWIAQELLKGDRAAVVSKAALEGGCDLAVEALKMFVEIYGSMAGNLALVIKSTGGLYVGGGIAPKIIGKLKDGTFMRHFHDKGRMTPLVETIPVRVILDDKTALYGAALCALLR